MLQSHEDLSQETTRATEMLQGKVVARIARHLENEVLIEFPDDTHLLIDRSGSAVDLSITGGPPE